MKTKKPGRILSLVLSAVMVLAMLPAMSVTAGAAAGIVISFDARNGSTIANATTGGTGTITLPTAPTWEDYTFAGWCTGIDGTGSMITADTVHGANATVYAKWTKGGKTVRTTPLDLTSVATTNKIANEGWSWDSTAKVLTLDGLTLHNIALKNQLLGEIVLVSGATVDVKGTNTVIGGADATQGLGIMNGATGGSLSICGTGILNVTAYRMAIGAMDSGDLTISGSVTVNAQSTGPDGAGIIAAVNLTLKDQVKVSAKGGFADLYAGKAIIAAGATVTGAKEPFTSGTTTQLTRSGTDPVVISFGPPPTPTFDVVYDVVNSTGTGSRLERSLDVVATNTNEGVTKADKADGKSVSLKLTVTEKTAANTPDKDKVEGVQQGDSLQYYDVKVEKIVTPAGGSPTTTVLTSIPKPVQAVIPVPLAIQGKTSYTVYRVHNGTAEKIPNDPTAAEFYTMDAGGTSLTLTVSKFSTYAVITNNKSLTGDHTFGDATNPKSSAVDVQGKVIEGMFGVYKLDVSWGAMKFDYNAQGKVWNPDTHVYDANAVAKGWIKESFEAGNNKITVANHSNGDVWLSYIAKADAVLAGTNMTVRATNSLQGIEAKDVLLAKVPSETAAAPTTDAYVWLTGEPTNLAGLNGKTYTKAGVITITAVPDTANGLTPKKP